MHKSGERRNYKTCLKCCVNDERPTGKKITCECDDGGKIGKIILVLVSIRAGNKDFLPASWKTVNSSNSLSRCSYSVHERYARKGDH